MGTGGRSDSRHVGRRSALTMVLPHEFRLSRDSTGVLIPGAWRILDPARSPDTRRSIVGQTAARSSDGEPFAPFVSCLPTTGQPNLVTAWDKLPLVVEVQFERDKLANWHRIRHRLTTPCSLGRYAVGAAATPHDGNCSPLV